MMFRTLNEIIFVVVVSSYLTNCVKVCKHNVNKMLTHCACYNNLLSNLSDAQITEDASLFIICVNSDKKRFTSIYISNGHRSMFV